MQYMLSAIFTPFQIYSSAFVDIACKLMEPSTAGTNLFKNREQTAVVSTRR